MDYSPKIVVFDLDGTITKKDTYLPFLFGFLRNHPQHIFRCGFLPFAVFMHLAGMRDNTWLKKVFLKAFLKGVNKEIVSEWVNEFVDKTIDYGLRDGALYELELHKQAGDTLLLVSASLDVYVNTFGGKLGFDYVLCTNAEWDDQDRLTGGLISNNCYGEEKISRLKEWLHHQNRQHIDIAYSDHHSDIHLLSFAKTGVAVCPSKKLSSLIHGNRLKLQYW